MTPSSATGAGSPFAPSPSPGVPLCAYCPGKFVKNQYEFPSDFRFVSERCRKATVRVKDRCNKITLRGPWGSNGAGHGAERACRRLLRAANQHRRGEGTGGVSGRQRERRDRRLRLRTVILGVPFGPGTAHVVQLRPIWVEQGSGQTVQQFADVASSPRFVAASSASENCGRCPDHDGIRLGSLSHPLVGDRAAGRGSTERQFLELNLRKTPLLRS